MSNCKKHIVPEYLQDLEKVANDLADMPYDKVIEFFDHFGKKLRKDAKKDYDGQRFMLSIKLNNSAFRVEKVKEELEKVWKLCEPYMK